MTDLVDARPARVDEGVRLAEEHWLTAADNLQFCDYAFEGTCVSVGNICGVEDP